MTTFFICSSCSQVRIGWVCILHRSASCGRGLHVSANARGLACTRALASILLSPTGGPDKRPSSNGARASSYAGIHVSPSGASSARLLTSELALAHGAQVNGALQTVTFDFADVFHLN